MLTFRPFPSRVLTGAVAAAALTVFATSAMAQTARDTAPTADLQQQRGMMMQQERMQPGTMQPTQPTQQRDMMLQRERMQQQGAMQQRPMRAQPGVAAGAASVTPSMQERLQNWNMDRYIQMHQAVSAHQNCRQALSSPAMSAIIQRIEAQAGEPPSPGRKLAIQDDAQFNMKEIVRVNGCADPRVKAALQMFDTTLAPAMQEATAAAPQ